MPFAQRATSVEPAPGKSATMRIAIIPGEPETRAVSIPTTLADWLAYLETLHPKAIAMGLSRVRAVYQRMDIALDCPVITVTGTNGKGSTCAMLDAILRADGYRTGMYTSPHLLRYNERVRIDGVEATDEAIVEALQAVERARIVAIPPTPLTYFEFGTLAALWLFAREKLDAIVLEVGLGGRLDAVNVVDPSVAIVTSVDLDHMDYLGPTREDIAREKAGVFRGGRPAVCGEPDPPATLLEHAREVGANLARIGIDYGYEDQRTQWRYFGPGGPRHGLPHPALRGRYQLANAATALAALGFLREALPVDAGAIRDGLLRVDLPARFQVLPGRPTVVLDVAHNPHAARVLAETLGAMGFHAQTYAVFGMLADKDIAGVIRTVAPRIDRWFVASLPGPRGAAADALRAALIAQGVKERDISAHETIAQAYDAAAGAANEADRIVAFGSFLTVAGALAARDASDTKR
jgi:dihydrofolate synthase/folylpolyglutamate synthase